MSVSDGGSLANVGSPTFTASRSPPPTHTMNRRPSFLAAKAPSLSILYEQPMLRSFNNKRGSSGGLFSINSKLSTPTPAPADTFTAENNPLSNIPLEIQQYQGEVRITALTAQPMSSPLQPLAGVKEVNPPSEKEQAERQRRARIRCPRRIPYFDENIPLDTYVRVTLLPTGIGAMTEVVTDSGTDVQWNRPQRMQLHYEGDEVQKFSRQPTGVSVGGQSKKDASLLSPASPVVTSPIGATGNKVVVVSDVASFSSQAPHEPGAGFFIPSSPPSPSLHAIDERVDANGHTASPSMQRSSQVEGKQHGRQPTAELNLHDTAAVQMAVSSRSTKHSPPPPPPSPPHVSVPASHMLLQDDPTLLALTNSNCSNASTTAPARAHSESYSPKFRKQSHNADTGSGVPPSPVLGGASSQRPSCFVGSAGTDTLAAGEKEDSPKLGLKSTNANGNGHSATTDTTDSKQPPSISIPPAASPTPPPATAVAVPGGPLLLVELICCSPDRKCTYPLPKEDRLIASVTYDLRACMNAPGVMQYNIPLNLLDVEDLEEHGQAVLNVCFTPDNHSPPQDQGAGESSSFCAPLLSPPGMVEIEVISVSGFNDPFNPKALFQLDWSLMRRMAAAVLLYLVAGTLFYYFEEKWSVLDSIYFVLVTATTTGFGDKFPTTVSSRVFTIFFILVGIGMIAIALGIAGGLMLERQEQALYQQLIQERQAKLQAEQGMEAKKPFLSLTAQRLLSSFVQFNIVLWGGAIGFYYLEADYTFFECVYLCVVTMSTVGYGSDVSPKSTAGRAFCCPWIVVSALIVTRVVGEITDIYMTYMRNKRAEAVLKNSLNSVEDLAALDDDNSGQVSELEFLKHMLVKTGASKQHQIDTICQQFRNLDVDGSGFLDADDFAKMDADKNLRRQSNAVAIGVAM